jgi:hypothetical protein
MTTTTETPLAKVGDILYRSWGYDQTNVNFYQVVKVSPSGKTIYYYEVQTYRTGYESVSPLPGQFYHRCKNCDNLIKSVPGFGGWTHGIHVECSWPEGKVAEPKLYSGRVKPKYAGSEEYRVNFNSYSDLYLWDGRARYQTPAGGGH